MPWAYAVRRRVSWARLTKEGRFSEQMKDATFSANLEVESTSVLLALSGPQSALLAEVARQSGAEVSLRGNTIYLSGGEGEVKLAHRFLADAAELVEKGFELSVNDVAGALRGLRADPGRSLTELLDETPVAAARSCRRAWPNGSTSRPSASTT
jgi:phosphate starvation-inducible protein PhoH